MIATRLTGGLGNQLFQYAAGRALAIRHQTQLVLDTSSFSRVRHGETPRAFELAFFNVQAQVSQDASVARAGALRRAPSLARWLTPWRPYVEKGLHFNADHGQLPDQTLLVGYWQSYRYFEDCAAVIAQDFTPAQPLSTLSIALSEEMQATHSVALHVRRGDYVSLKAAASLHGALPLTYYQEAIARITQSVEQPRFYIFSDDPEWCRQHLPLDAHRSVSVVHNVGNDAWQDLVLMGHCHHHVIANSSFSWWGAWLADQRWAGLPRTVVAPAQWFAGQSHSTVDRFPGHWLRAGASS